MKKFITIALLSLFTFTQAQKGIKVTYLKSSNGTLIENQDPILLFTNKTETLLTSESIHKRKAKFPFEQSLIFRSDDKIMQITQ